MLYSLILINRCLNFILWNKAVTTVALQQSLIIIVIKPFTIQNVIVLNALVFMHKARHFPLDLPRYVIKTIAENSPLPGATHESSNEWLQNISYYLYIRSVFYKGPLLSIIPEISELVTPPTLFNAKIYKKYIRKALIKYQSSGNAEEWQSGNFLLSNILD